MAMNRNVVPDIVYQALKIADRKSDEVNRRGK